MNISERFVKKSIQMSKGKRICEGYTVYDDCINVCCTERNCEHYNIRAFRWKCSFKGTLEPILTKPFRKCWHEPTTFEWDDNKGHHWGYKCKGCGKLSDPHNTIEAEEDYPNPDLTTADGVLDIKRYFEEQGLWPNFKEHCGIWGAKGLSDKYYDRNGTMLKEALKFLEGLE